MTSWLRTKVRALLGWRVPKAKLSLYVALASCVLTFFTLFAAGAVFEVQRTDVLLFELERRYREYDYLIASIECVNSRASVPDRSADDIKRLRDVRADLRDALSSRGAMTLDELTHLRDEVLSDASEAAARLARDILNERSNLDGDRLDKMIRVCGL